MWNTSCTPALLQQPSHCELWPQALIGLFPSFKCFQESKATGTAQTWMPTPWPPPALSRYNRPGPLQYPSAQSLGLFAFTRRTSASFSLLMLTGLPAISSFWEMLPRCQGPGIANYQLLMGTWQSRFHEHPKIQEKLCWRKDSGILELQALELCGCAQ